VTPSRIVLVGFMASGKSTLGRELARRLGWGFRDLDAWIEERNGASVPEIFASLGEPAFRELEREAAAAAGELREHVIAAGGGAFAQPATRALLRSGAISVWLRCRLETVLERVGDGRGRPLACNRATIEKLFAEREPSYRLAEIAVDTDSASPEELTEHLTRNILGPTVERRVRGA
jgi:shikimate kinase